MVRGFFRFLCFVAVLLVPLGVAHAKTFKDLWRYETATRIATPAHMVKRQITADPFMITVFERIRNKGGVADIYIGGDGTRMDTGVKPVAQAQDAPPAPMRAMDERTANWPLGVNTKNQADSQADSGRSSPAMSILPKNLNPTPDYPVALHLAAFDRSDNVIYVARPCQFSGMAGAKPGTQCTKDHWSDGRYSIDTMNAMNAVLDSLARRYGFTGFNLIGFDGGAAVAVLLAAKRKDVLSLRTVGGILDTDQYEADHKRAPLTGSLNPKDFARDVAGIPQIHFLGQWDKDVTPDVYQSFKNAMGQSACIRYSLVAGVNHVAGWANRWPSLLKQVPDCRAEGE